MKTIENSFDTGSGLSRNLHVLLVLTLTLLASLSHLEAVPLTLHYQGQVTVDGEPFTGTGQFKFVLLSSPSETAWSHDLTSENGAEPATSLALGLQQGVYSIALGDPLVTGMSAIPVDVFGHESLALRVWFDDGTNGFQLLTPDRAIGSVAFAVRAESAAMADRAALADAVDAENISGVLPVSKVPNLDAAKVTTGTFDVLRIPTLDAGQTMTGVFDAARIPDLDAGKIATGTLEDERLSAAIARTSDVTSMISALSLQLATLEERVDAVDLAALTTVSTESEDAMLVGLGYESFYTIPAPGWTEASATLQPGPRSQHTLLWTGSRLLVWGGSADDNVFLGTGSSYDPVNDEWQPLSTIDDPEPRNSHTDVWSGSQMIVWGGFNAGGFLGTGGRYNPVSLQWLPITSTDAPAERSGHVAVWTGSRMVVWGGRNAAGLLADGAIYDPSTDDWAPLAVAGAPSARFDAAAVWLGDRMLVWGGEGESGEVGDGAQLIFAGGVPDRWEPVATLNAPAARTGHSLIAAGDVAIVFGGEDSGSLLGDGASYYPATDTWTSLATLNAPSPRTGHAAVWTGSVMHVLSGTEESGETGSGATYDPSTDRWSGLSQAGDPADRTGARAAWIGDAIAIFGGTAGGSAVGRLQRLTPRPDFYFYRKP